MPLLQPAKLLFVSSILTPASNLQASIFKELLACLLSDAQSRRTDLIPVRPRGLFAPPSPLLADESRSCPPPLMTFRPALRHGSAAVRLTMRCQHESPPAIALPPSGVVRPTENLCAATARSQVSAGVLRLRMAAVPARWFCTYPQTRHGEAQRWRATRPLSGHPFAPCPWNRDVIRRREPDCSPGSDSHGTSLEDQRSAAWHANVIVATTPARHLSCEQSRLSALRPAARSGAGFFGSVRLPPPSVRGRVFPRFPQLPDRIVKIIFRTNGRIQIKQSNPQYPGDE